MTHPTALEVLITLPILSLAAWRLSSLLVRERGPGDSLAKLRRFVGVRYDEYSTAHAATPFAGVFICLWCNTVWTGLVLAIAWWLWPRLTILVTLPLSLSGGAILIDNCVNKEA